MNDEQTFSTPPQNDGGSGQPRTSDRFFTWLRGLGIVRGNDRWFAGVAGGIAAKAGIDPLIVRGILVVLAVLGGPGILLYLAGWLLLPDYSGRIHIEELFRGRASAGVIVAVVLLGIFVAVPLLFNLLSTLFSGSWFNAPWGIIGPDWLHTVFSVIWFALLLPALIIGAIIWISTSRRGNGPHPQNRPHHHPPHPHGSAASASPMQAPPTATYAPPAGPTAQTAPAATFAEPSATAPAGGASFAADATGTTTSTEAGSTPPPAPGEGAAQQTWANQFGDWSRNVREEAKQWNDLGHQHHQHHKIGAAHAVLTLALALLAAGAAAAWALSQSVNQNLVLTSALLAAVAVLAVSVIVAGVRGRHTGWIGFLSLVGVLALLFAPFTGVLPENTRLLPFGGHTVTAGDIDQGAGDKHGGVVTVAGSTRLDLTQLTAESAPHDIEIWVLAGSVTVQLPDNAPVEVEADLLAGGVREQREGASFSEGGPFLSHTVSSATEGRSADAVSRVRVRVLFGNVRIEGGDVPSSFHGSLQLGSTGESPGAVPTGTQKTLETEAAR
ncbi:MAG: PspC domain-containing protein [Actinobacteria bacterium]|nr:PspC domain-containing protein [Actinomycetota bacterium]